jgi:hypothetical protein
MKVSIPGVLIGGLVDVVSSVIAGLPFALYVALKLDPSQRIGPHASQAVTAALRANFPLYSAELLTGLLCSVLGGYVAAAIAKRQEHLNGTLSSWLCVGLGITTMFLGLSREPVWLGILLLLASPVCAFVGGDLRLRQRRSHPLQPAV